jgi:hypothetical protein
LGVLPPNMALDWELDRVEDEDEDSSLAIMDAFKENFLRKLRLHSRRPKVGGRF